MPKSNVMKKDRNKRKRLRYKISMAARTERKQKRHQKRAMEIARRNKGACQERITPN